MESIDESLADVLVLYASETGNAVRCAQKLDRELGRNGYSTRVCSLDQYSVVELPDETLVLFVVSTTGKYIFLK